MGAVRQLQTSLRSPAIAQPQTGIRPQEGRATRRGRRRVRPCINRVRRSFGSG
jgi:hypothetical protein